MGDVAHFVVGWDLVSSKGRGRYRSWHLGYSPLVHWQNVPWKGMGSLVRAFLGCFKQSWLWWSLLRRR